MIREDLGVLAQPIGIQILDRNAYEAVKVPTALDQERAVRNLLGQGMLEHVRQLGKHALFVDQLLGLELTHYCVSAVVDVCQPVNQAVIKLSPDYRGQLQDP